MKYIIFIMLCCCVLNAHAQQDTRKTDAEAITAAYSEWAKAANDKDIDYWVTFLGPDAVFMPPDREALTTNDEIRDMYIESFKDPNWSISCEQLEVDVAQAGDMAWSRGECTTTVSNQDGKVNTIHGKWMKVWLKQPNGIWKNKLNGFSPAHPVSSTH